MIGCYVRCLFGNPLVDGYPGLLNDLALRSRDPVKLEPTLWCVWGRENAAAVKAAGFCPVVMSEESIPGNGQPADYETAYGVRPYGYNIYRLKFHAIRKVLENFGDTVFLDLDVAAIRQPPEDFWSVLRSGKPIQAPAVQYHRVQCPWRKRFRRTSIYCATLYVRGTEVLDRCEAYADAHPLAFEQEAINHTMDEMHGGNFYGPDGYRLAGFEFPFTEARGGMIYKPREAVFKIHSKGWSIWKKKGPAAWREYVRSQARAKYSTHK